MKNSDNKSGKDANKKASNTPVDQSTPSQEPSQQDLDTVRDILFGAQKRAFEEKNHAYEAKHQEIEALIQSSVQTLRDELKQATKELSKEISDVKQALASEEKSRLADNTLRATEIANLDQTLGDLEKNTSAGADDLQDQLMALSENIRKQLDELHDELTLSIQSETAKLNDNKADRSSLASLLSGIANQLAGGASGAMDEDAQSKTAS